MRKWNINPIISKSLNLQMTSSLYISFYLKFFIDFFKMTENKRPSSCVNVYAQTFIDVLFRSM